ncbi:hypothetical protein H696_03985 [Fonticula alba]|uniref:Uncharacterized protein n=1 Tax=Fonticula alba TaxID=691883 RepID=A0A058Z6M4_FONAL|nr:hypothetical protein H696_03985 [Fonticula alba]KCV69563.1 hypothetical protein H696_03985 [Fonticula alba]|eukprot:XP_009496128.1 hypothetical protein H696_03985 [Fonticula alba]
MGKGEDTMPHFAQDSREGLFRRTVNSEAVKDTILDMYTQSPVTTSGVEDPHAFARQLHSVGRKRRLHSDPVPPPEPGPPSE